MNIVCFSEEIRRQESTNEYTIKLVGSNAEITRDSDNEVRNIKGVLFGEHPMMRHLPKKVLSPDGESALLPMEDFSYWVISFDDYFEGNEFGLVKLVGGGNKGRGYDKTPLFWFIEELLPNGLFKGKVASGRDDLLGFIASIDEKVVYAVNPDIQTSLLLRIEEVDNSMETPFIYEVDKTKFIELSRGNSKEK